MSEYIFAVPDENEPIAGESSVYYPDERDEPMQVCEEIVRCGDCMYYHEDQDLCKRLQPGMLVMEPDSGFCAWGERRNDDR